MNKYEQKIIEHNKHLEEQPEKFAQYIAPFYNEILDIALSLEKCEVECEYEFNESNDYFTFEKGTKSVWFSIHKNSNPRWSELIIYLPDSYKENILFYDETFEQIIEKIFNHLLNVFGKFCNEGS